MSNITFKGTTDTALGVVTESISWYKKPQKRSESVLIENSDGAIVNELGFAPLVIPAVIGLKSAAVIDDVIAWIDGSGVLICSDDPLKYRNARILEQIDYDKLIRFKKAAIEFLIEKPFRYVLNESDVVETSFPATYVNAGALISKPLLKVSGTGTVVFVVNGTTLTYVFDTAYVYIDCDTMDAYYLTTLKNRNLSITGNVYPTLSVGSNTISITSGTITSIVITPRTRFI